MFENIKNLISKDKTPEQIRAELEIEIIKLGDVGVKCALEFKLIPREMAIDKLDMIRLKGEESHHTFVSVLASRQIDRIIDATG